MNEFGKRLRELRLKSDKSLRDLDELSGLSYSFIGSLEKGRFKPSRDSIHALAEALKANEDELLMLAGFLPNNEPLALGEDSAVPSLEVFSYRLNQGMKDKNITPEQAAEECGVTPEYIQELMTAPKKLPGAATLLNLAILIDVTPDYLGGFTDDPKGYNPLTPKPKDLRMVLEEEEIMFDGRPLSEDDKEMILGVINALNVKGKKMNKRKKGTS